MVEIFSGVLEVISFIKDFFNKKQNEQRIISFKEKELTDGIAQLNINGSIGSLNIYVIKDENNNTAFASKNNEQIKKSLDRAGSGEIIENKFSEVYDEYVKFDKEKDYPYPFINRLDTKYKALIKASSYIESLYKLGDRDIAAQRKNSLEKDFPNLGRKFCNLYTAGYVPEVLKFIDEIGLSDGNTINKILDSVITYNNIFFVHQNTDLDILTSKLILNAEKGEHYNAIHGAGMNVQKVQHIEKEAKNKEVITQKYRIENSQDKSESGVDLYSVFFFDAQGQKIYEQFTSGAFKGFI